MPPLSRQDDLAQTFSSLNLEAASPAPSEAACVVLYHAACLLHTFTRPQNNSDQIEAHDASIVERPERLRAVLAGVHAAMARHPGRISLQTTEASLSLASAAVRAIHGPLHVTDDVHYASNLQDWLDNVDSRHKKGLSEIPEGFSQGDLYLAAGPKGSQLAIQGALGAACQAIDEVCADPDQGGIRFVAARPPGHVSPVYHGQ